MKTIKHAAIKLDSGEIYTGKSHAHCSEKIRDKERAGGGYARVTSKMQGFVDSDGKFVTRAEAANIARSAGQLPEYYYEGLEIKSAFSEEFWSKEHGGQHEYDEEKGYYKN
jgi:hypothetical protein